MNLLRGFATAKATARFRARSNLAENGYSTFDGISLSAVGLGTYLGAETDHVDELYSTVIQEALRAGINVIDTASVYRSGRSERVIGAAIRAAVTEGLICREECFVVTKGGYLGRPYAPSGGDGRWLEDVEESYVKPGIMRWGDIANGAHCLAGGILEHELPRSQARLGLETVDLY